MKKNEIRRFYLQKRLNLSSDEIAVMSTQIARNFKQIPISEISFYLSYSSLKIKREFDPSEIENLISLKFPEAVKTLPVVEDDTTMQAVQFEKSNALVKNRYGIEEPEVFQPVEAKNLDLVLVPLLAVDFKGNRAGFGKGYYDRYLKTCRKDVLTIGCSFFEPVDEIEDRNEFDVPLKYCVTPDQIYEF